MIISEADKEFIRNNESVDIFKLALQLNKSDYSKEYIDFIINQISGRNVSKKKIESWYNNEDIIYPPHLSMEQSSSETTAKYKTHFIEDSNSLLDLTGGLGVDFYFLASSAKQATYVEQNEMLCKIANYNFKALNLNNYLIINKSGEEYLRSMQSTVDVIYIDPSRRDTKGKKVFRIADCSPNIIEIQEDLIQKASKTIIKFSPMLDISIALREVNNISEIHVVSVDNECKELILIISKSKDPLIYHTINIKGDGGMDIFRFSHTQEQESIIQYTNIICKYLYEPNASILKAGAFKSIAEHFNILKLNPNSHLYTSDTLIENFPGRCFEVKKYFNPSKKNIKELSNTNSNKANISVRNYPFSVSEIRKSTKLKDGGETYIFATTLNSGQKIWIECRKV